MRNILALIGYQILAFILYCSVQLGVGYLLIQFNILPEEDASKSLIKSASALAGFYFWALIPIVFSQFQKEEKRSVILKMFIIILLAGNAYFAIELVAAEFLMPDKVLNNFKLISVILLISTIIKFALLPALAWRLSKRFLKSYTQKIQHDHN